MPNKEDENVDKPTEMSEELPKEDDIEDLETSQSKIKDGEKVEGNKDVKTNKKQHPDGMLIQLVFIVT